ncbi:MAG: homocysteine S-methyltransferase family protein [Acidobacteria bacterium]|nr:homocysteine S-methyltransferase family protein [Acidobacteriota bacterium]
MSSQQRADRGGNGRADAARKRKLQDKEIIIMDGGIGTEILRRGVNWASHQIQDDPGLVRSIHADYIATGADVITTNTFQLSRRSFRNHFNDRQHMEAIGALALEEQADELIRDAVGLARQAREASGREEVSIAGSMTTLEWCFRPDLTPETEAMQEEYRQQVQLFRDAGADLILFETFNRVAEARIALQAAAELKIPAWMGFVSDAEGRLLSGETMRDVAAGLKGLTVEVVLINCCPVDHTTRGMEELARHWPGPTGAFAHVGKFYPPVWHFTDECPPERYLKEARRWKELGAAVIGGCCGTTPPYIDLLNSDLR